MTFEILSDILTSPFFLLTVVFAAFGYLVSDMHKHGFYIGGVIGLIVAAISSMVAFEYLLSAFLLLVIVYAIMKRK